MKFTSSLNKNHEFKRLYNRGKSLAAPSVAIYFRRNGTTENRLGITVSTKIGGAVVRNRIRRRFKEIYRLNEDKLQKGFDVVIVARMKSRFMRYRDLESAVLLLLKKLKLTEVQDK